MPPARAGHREQEPWASAAFPPTPHGAVVGCQKQQAFLAPRTLAAAFSAWIVAAIADGGLARKAVAKSQRAK